MEYDIFEDEERKEYREERTIRHSPFCDFVYYTSSRDVNIKLGLKILKPCKPSYILVMTHGWHMSIPGFENIKDPSMAPDYLTLYVDMRGRAYSDGKPDCNGWELMDVIDAVNYVRENYSEHIIDKEVVYFKGGSGGGGNCYSIIGKFPDFFAAATALCGISDYARWYEGDTTGEFRDEMDIWIGSSPVTNPMAYESRSGIYLIENLITPLFIAHGETDLRVPVEHARNYVKKANSVGKRDKISYLELQGVGTGSHWGKATDKQINKIEELCECNRKKNRKSLDIPEKGRLYIGGFLFTKRFSIVLDNIDKTAVLDYDINEKRFDIKSRTKCDYNIRIY